MTIVISPSVAVCLFCLFCQLLTLVFQIGVWLGRKVIASAANGEKR